MQPASPDLTLYQQLLDTLLRYDTSQQVAEHLTADSRLLDRTLLHTLAARPAPHQAASHAQQWLQKVLTGILAQKLMAEYLNCPAPESFTYAVAHPELLTEENYGELQHLIDQADKQVEKAGLLERQAKLMQAATTIFTLQPDCLASQFNSLPAPSWLAHPAAQAHLDWAAGQYPETAGRIAELNQTIALQIEEMKAMLAAQVEELNRLINKINLAKGDDLIRLLHAVLPLAQTAYPELWLELEVALGSALSTSFSGSRAQNLEDAIAAYQLALQGYPREEYEVQWAGTQNNLGNAYRSRLRGERAQNLEEAIAAYRLVYASPFDKPVVGRG